MNITQFTQTIGQYVPANHDYMALGNRLQYNQQKDVNDTILLVLPNPYPIWWLREEGQCSEPITFDLYLFKKVNIKASTTGNQQQNPYSPTETRDTMATTLMTMVQAIYDDPHIQLRPASPLSVNFEDAIEGPTVNSQAAAWVRLEAVLIYKDPNEFDPVLDEQNNLIYDENLQIIYAN